MASTSTARQPKKDHKKKAPESPDSSIDDLSDYDSSSGSDSDSEDDSNLKPLPSSTVLGHETNKSTKLQYAGMEKVYNDLRKIRKILKNKLLTRKERMKRTEKILGKTVPVCHERMQSLIVSVTDGWQMVNTQQHGKRKPT